MKNNMAALNRNIKKILIFRNGDIGNTLMATPFFRMLKEFYPEAEVHVVVERIGKELLKNDPNIDKFYIFNKKKDNLSIQLNLVKEWRVEKYDVSFHLRAGIRNEILAFLSGIPVRIGFPLKGSFQFLTIKIIKKEISHHFELGRMILSNFHDNVPVYKPRLQVDPYEKSNLNEKLKANNLKCKEYCVIHPAGKTIKKDNWQLSFFCDIIELIQDSFQLPCVVIGSANERDEIEKSLNVTRQPIFWFQDDIGETSELIRQSKIFCGNDSGPFHIAECWDIPSIVLYRDNENNFLKWHPLNDDTSVPVFHSELNDKKTIMNKINKVLNNWV